MLFGEDPKRKIGRGGWGFQRPLLIAQKVGESMERVDGEEGDYHHDEEAISGGGKGEGTKSTHTQIPKRLLYS